KARRQAKNGASHKGPAPSIPQHDPGNQRRRKSGAHSNAGKNTAVREPAFRRRYPTGNKLIRSGVNYSFASAQRKANSHKSEQRGPEMCGNRRGQRRENPPPHHSKRQHAPCAKFVRKAASWSLEKRVPG